MARGSGQQQPSGTPESGARRGLGPEAARGSGPDGGRAAAPVPDGTPPDGATPVAASWSERLRAALEAALLAAWFPEHTARGAAAVTPAVLGVVRAAAPLLAAAGCVVARIARKRRRRIEAARAVRRAGAPHGPLIVVVGNLVAGGTGKTPIVQGLARALARSGWRVGIVVRSYRGRAAQARLVDAAADDADRVGDEALLHARATGLPVASGPRRRDALALLEPLCDVVLCDDGLQHEPLPRDVELAVFDERGAGNGRCLPAGPLREPLGALADIDAVIWNESGGSAPAALQRQVQRLGRPTYASHVEPARFVRLDGSGEWDTGAFVAAFGSEPLTVVAGIARPQRFVDTLCALGLDRARLDFHPLPDHARVDQAALARLPGRWLLVTAKDAVKCAPHGPGAARIVWLDVRAEPQARLLHCLDRMIRQRIARDP